MGMEPASLGQPHYGGLSSASSNSAELDRAESFLLQPSSKPTVCDDGVPNAEDHKILSNLCYFMKMDFIGFSAKFTVKGRRCIKAMVK